MTPQEKALVQRILNCLGHEELGFKQLGDVSNAACIRYAIVKIMKLTGESDPEPIDPPST